MNMIYIILGMYCTYVSASSMWLDNQAYVPMAGDDANNSAAQLLQMSWRNRLMFPHLWHQVGGIIAYCRN